MDKDFTPQYELEEYFWMVFHNLEKKPDADWCKPSRYVWEKVTCAMKVDGSFSKKEKLSMRHISKPIKMNRYEKD